MPKKKKCSWRVIESACRNISKSIHRWSNYQDSLSLLPDLMVKSSEDIDYVIGIARGGLVPATMLSHILGKDRVYTIGTKLYDDCLKSDKLYIYQDCFNDHKETFAGKTLLLVDDISDSGKTFESIRAHIRKTVPGATILTASIYIRHNTKYIPDFFYKKIKDDTWIHFPFE